MKLRTGLGSKLKQRWNKKRSEKRKGSKLFIIIQVKAKQVFPKTKRVLWLSVLKQETGIVFNGNY